MFLAFAYGTFLVHVSVKSSQKKFALTQLVFKKLMLVLEVPSFHFEVPLFNNLYFRILPRVQLVNL